MKNELAVLDKVLPVVVRVHGGEHAELADIQKAYHQLKEALEREDQAKEPMRKIRELTKDYILPEDACEAYAKVYHALAALDKLI